MKKHKKGWGAGAHSGPMGALHVASLSIAKMLPSKFHQKLNFISKSKLVMKLHQVSSSELRIYGIKALTEDYHFCSSNLEKELRNEVL